MEHHQSPVKLIRSRLSDLTLVCGQPQAQPGAAPRKSPSAQRVTLPHYSSYNHGFGDNADRLSTSTSVIILLQRQTGHSQLFKCPIPLTGFITTHTLDIVVRLAQVKQISKSTRAFASPPDTLLRKLLKSHPLHHHVV